MVFVISQNTILDEIKFRTTIFAEFSRNFAQHFLNFAKFRRDISFAKKFSKCFFRKMILPKFRETLFSYFARFCRIIFFANKISGNFVRYLVLRKKFHEISSNNYFAK